MQQLDAAMLRELSLIHILPGTDGLEVCKRIRDHISCPILFLTARIADTDKVKGLTVGGDDYIVKPVSYTHLPRFAEQRQIGLSGLTRPAFSLSSITKR